MLAIKKTKLTNEKGMAVLEMIPLIIIIMVLLVFTSGFFGTIHTAILSSITARNYAFETMRHRADLTYFRSAGIDMSTKNINFAQNGFRLHYRIDRNNSTIVASMGRRIDQLMPGDDVGTSANMHLSEVQKVQFGKRYTDTDGVNPIWIRVQYGICINSKCGD